MVQIAATDNLEEHKHRREDYLCKVSEAQRAMGREQTYCNDIDIVAEKIHEDPYKGRGSELPNGYH